MESLSSTVSSPFSICLHCQAYCKREPLNPNSNVIRPNSEASVKIMSSRDRDSLSAITPLVDLSVDGERGSQY